MYVCMYACMYVYIYIYIHIYVHIHVYIYICTYTVHMYIYIYMYIYICINIYIYIYATINIYIYYLYIYETIIHHVQNRHVQTPQPRLQHLVRSTCSSALQNNTMVCWEVMLVKQFEYHGIYSVIWCSMDCCSGKLKPESSICFTGKSMVSGQDFPVNQSIEILVGGWATPLKNIKVSWDYSPTYGKKKAPNRHPANKPSPISPLEIGAINRSQMAGVS